MYTNYFKKLTARAMPSGTAACHRAPRDAVGVSRAAFPARSARSSTGTLRVFTWTRASSITLSLTNAALRAP